jgi:Tfp pilus assembly protein PilF
LYEHALALAPRSPEVLNTFGEFLGILYKQAKKITFKYKN